ncbi:MAG: hypothetical protein KDA54_09480 [Phycisphaerales bacterium]|nr:hypothetical protein [Phycisphaerales bacterium]
MVENFTITHEVNHGNGRATAGLIDTPMALGDVTLELSAWMALEETSEYGDVSVDGTFVGRLFEANGDGGCIGGLGDPPATDSLVIPMALWNSARSANGNTVTVVVDYTQVDSPTCTNPRTRFVLTIPGDGDSDDDGILNVCEFVDCDNNGIHDGVQQDSDGNGVIDFCEPGSGAANGLDITVVGIPGSGTTRWTFRGTLGGWYWNDNGYRFDVEPDRPMSTSQKPFKGPGGTVMSVGDLTTVGRCEIFTAGRSYLMFRPWFDYTVIPPGAFTGNGVPRTRDEDISSKAPGTTGNAAGTGLTLHIIHCTSPDDSDGDGVPDDCDEYPGIDDWQDCNGNGVPDGAELEGPFHFELQEGGIPCAGTSRTPMEDLAVPASVGDVTIEMAAYAPGYVNADEYVEVYGNGVPLGTLFSGTVSGTCNVTDTLTVDASTWESARQVEQGKMTLEFRPSPNATCDQCTLIPLVTYTVDYIGDNDENDNGVLDACPLDCDPSGPDSDGDGVSDSCDECPNTIGGHASVDARGCPLGNSPWDRDLDGDVDPDDITGFFGCAAGPDAPVGGSCAADDVNADGFVDLLDYLGLQDAVSGADQMAEVASAGADVPHIRAVQRDFELTWDQANLHCQQLFGTQLASWDPNNLTASEQRARIDEMTALAAGRGNGDFWFGLRYDVMIEKFRWFNGELFVPQDECGAGCTWPISETNWWGDGQTPRRADFAAGSTAFCALLWEAAGYKWRNADGYGAPELNANGCMCDAPEGIFLPGTLGGDEGGDGVLDVRATSEGITTITVETGATFTFDVRAMLDSTDTLGLAGFAFDVSFDGGDLTPMDTPAAMADFTAPKGFSNPAGYGGTVVNGDLIQVGGGQNTINYVLADGPTGMVMTGIGYAEEILATGALTAPAMPGTYTVTIYNVNATTINAGEAGAPVWRAEPATVGVVTNLTVVVEACGDDDNDGVCNHADVCAETYDPDQTDSDGDGVGDACELPNDDCANAIPVPVGISTGSITYATIDGPGGCGTDPGRDVWFTYTNDTGVDVSAVMYTCSSFTDFDTVLTIYDGSCGGAQIACSDDSSSCGANNAQKSAIAWTVPCGATHLIQLSSKFDLPGDFSITTAFTATGPDSDGDGVGDSCDVCPNDANDDSDGDGVCDSVDQCPGSDDNIDTDGDGVPDDCDVCADVYDPNQLDSDGDGVGDACELANDDCANATPVPVGISNGSITHATIDGPGGCGTQPGRDVWFTYTNDTGVDVSAVMYTCSSFTEFDTVLTIYDGCGGSQIACSDDSSSCGANNAQKSAIAWTVPCGATHLIQLSSKFDLPGDFSITTAFTATGPDSDGDGVGDSCDVCPNDANDDSDGDGVCDSVDQCPGSYDNIDTDGDGVPNGCDTCAGGLGSGDRDGDGDIDLDDYAAMSNCLNGPAGNLAAGCECFDFDDDGDNDLFDFAEFQAGFLAS